MGSEEERVKQEVVSFKALAIQIKTIPCSRCPNPKFLRKTRDYKVWQPQWRRESGRTW